MKARLVIAGLDRYEVEGLSVHDDITLFLSEGEEVYVIKTTRKWEKRRVEFSRIKGEILDFTLRRRQSGSVEIAVD